MFSFLLVPAEDGVAHWTLQSDMSRGLLQLLPDGVQLHQGVVQFIGRRLYLPHDLLLAALLQLPGLFEEVVVHPVEESLD